MLPLQGAWVWSLVREGSSPPRQYSFAWKILWMEEPGRLQSMGSLRVGLDWVISLSLSCIGEGNGNPLQCSRLENPRDRGAWWAAVYGVTQSRTRLKWFSSSSSMVFPDDDASGIGKCLNLLQFQFHHPCFNARNSKDIGEQNSIFWGIQFMNI